MRNWSRREVMAAGALAAVSKLGNGKSAAAQEPKGQPQPEPKAVPPSERIVLGFIGVGGMGTGLVEIFKSFPEVSIAALCDVYEPHVKDAREKAGGSPAVHSDFRRVLDRKDIDAVVIATPDHWHGITTIMACQAGKDVYCEKPLAHRIQEGRAMVQAVEKYKRVSQMGNLKHAGKNYHRVVEIVRSGVLGKIFKTRVWLANDQHDLGPPGRFGCAGGLRL